LPRVGGALSAHCPQYQGIAMSLSTGRSGKAWLEARQPSGLASALVGGRSWWAHFEFTRINIELTILRKKFEDLRQAGLCDGWHSVAPGCVREKYVGWHGAGTTVTRRAFTASDECLSV